MYNDRDGAILVMANPHLLTGLGATAAVFFSCLGSSSASASGATYAMYIQGLTSHIPVIIAGVLGIYGLIIATILAQKLQKEDLEAVDGYKNLASGLAVGLTCYASGMGLTGFLEESLYGDGERRNRQGLQAALLTTTRSDPRTTPREPRPVTLKFVFMLCFLEALGLYGLIVALLIAG